MDETTMLDVTLEEGSFIPVREHKLDAGLDLRTPIRFVVSAHGFAFVDTGVHVRLPPSTCGRICSRSGLNRNHGITADGVIDEGYTGKIGVTLHNDSDEDFMFHMGDKIAQLVIFPIIRPIVRTGLFVFDGGDDRGDNGFGSTGR